MIACRVPIEEVEDRKASMWFWCVLGVALIGTGFLMATGMNLLLNWLRGVIA